ncbi:DUF624 domain-containing protein [Evansella sp. AB-P1]|uniref:YesL family protein n=1 Tax=Evansella sp. AB-P1 TaxID=3037653 RepID=UPI00241EDF8B|nr:DUF624 domain-containing protein [Evansella sp. AB-P1]MDG5788330.1 DUF624 domain-containing protein [Evansella sp. AB-P1]
MGKSQSTFYRILEIFTSFLLLNSLWLIFCLPLFTIFSSTAAMIGVTRKWLTKEIDFGVIKPFLQLFKENMKQGIIVQMLWIGMAIVLTVNFIIVFQNEFVGKEIIFSLTAFLSMIFMLMSIYLLPLMVHYHLSLKDLLKNSLFLSIGSLGTTFLCLGSLVAIIALTYIFPFAILISGSLTSIIVYQLCHKTFEKHKSHLNNKTA